MRPPRKRIWSREQIRSARAVDLPDLLRAQGFHLRETGAENYHIQEHPGITVKRSFWRSAQDDRAACPEHCRGGNAIDFFVFVLGRSFAEAMEAILKGQE